MYTWLSVSAHDEAQTTKACQESDDFLREALWVDTTLQHFGGCHICERGPCKQGQHLGPAAQLPLCQRTSVHHYVRSEGTGGIWFVLFGVFLFTRLKTLFKFLGMRFEKHQLISGIKLPMFSCCQMRKKYYYYITIYSVHTTKKCTSNWFDCWIESAAPSPHHTTLIWLLNRTCNPPPPPTPPTPCLMRMRTPVSSFWLFHFQLLPPGSCSLQKILRKYCILGCHTHIDHITASPDAKWLNTNSASYG